VSFGQTDDAGLTNAVEAPLRDVYLLDRGRLQTLKSSIEAHDPSTASMAAALQASTAKRRRCGPFAVTNKAATPPSGDKHDYTSLNPYRWPNPRTRDGLPYEKRDGRINPESKRYGDETVLVEFTKCVETLALASYLLGDVDAGRRGAQLVRVWFLAPATKMNPNATYAEMIPGTVKTSGVGTNQMREFLRVIDAVGLLAEMQALPAADVDALRLWFRAFRVWLQTSPEGREADTEEGNISSLYRAQLACYALFAGDLDVARAVLATIPTLILRQIEPGGAQPLELERTRSWNYSHTNLRALFSLARLGEHVGIDLWHAHAGERRRLRAALDFLAVYASGAKTWPYEQIQAFDATRTTPFLLQAAAVYRDPGYETLGKRLFATLDAGDQLWVTVGSLNAP
jgi:hypothetical protein